LCQPQTYVLKSDLYVNLKLRNWVYPEKTGESIS